jgi:hypothetical protein
MAKKKNNIPSGFNDILGNIYSNAESMEEVTNIDDIPVEDTPLEDNDDKVPPVEKTEDGEKVDDSHAAHEDDSEIPEDIKNNVNNQEQQTTEEEVHDTDEPSDADVVEAQQVGLLFDAIGQSLGWNTADIDENDRPLTVDDLVKHMVDTVRENSVPEYADDRIQALDEYVKNGGKFEDFYRIQQEGLNLESIDLEDENNQKQVVRELLKHDGYTDDQINKRLSRYEDADMLLEESEDALERLKNIRKAEAEAAAKEQEEYARQQYEQSKAFYDSVTKDINSLNTIRGIAIPKEDKKALFDYIFKVDQNGISQYQKDFNQNLSKNLIESAYFTMKGDALLSSAARSGESSATEKLRNLLRHSSKNHSSVSAEDKQKSVTDLLAGQF